MRILVSGQLWCSVKWSSRGKDGLLRWTHSSRLSRSLKRSVGHASNDNIYNTNKTTNNYFRPRRPSPPPAVASSSSLVLKAAGRDAAAPRPGLEGYRCRWRNNKNPIFICITLTSVIYYFQHYVDTCLFSGFDEHLQFYLSACNWELS